MEFKDFATETEGALLTASRLPLAENMARRVQNDKSIVLPMIASVVADFYDGEIQ